MTKVENNRAIQTDIINLENKIAWISSKISLGTKMAHYNTHFLNTSEDGFIIRPLLRTNRCGPLSIDGRSGEIVFEKVQAYVHTKGSFAIPSQEATCVAHDWFEAWEGVMRLNNVVNVLCWWTCVVVLLSFSHLFLWLSSSSKKNPKHHWSSYSTTIHSGPNPWLMRQYYLPFMS